MQKFFKSRLMRSIIPYFILGVLLIVAYRIIMGIEFFAGHIERFWSVVTPFLIGGVIAYILNIPCNGIQKLLLKIDNRFVKRRSRSLSVVIVLICMVGIITFSIYMIVPAVSRSITTFIDEFDSHVATVSGWMDTVESWNLPDFMPNIDQEMILGVVAGSLENIQPDNMAAAVVSGLGSTVSAVFSTILAIISSIYLMIEKDRFSDYVRRLTAAVTNHKTNETILKYTRKFNHNFHMYIYTQTLDVIVIGLLMTGLLLIFQSPHALLLGLILGVVNYIPYFGSIIGTVFAVIVVALTQGIPTGALAALFMFIIQQADANFIQPRLMGGSFSLSPLLVIISVTVGMAYAGVIGMLIAIPVIAILKDLLDEHIETKEYRKLNPPPPDDEEDFMDRGIG